MNSVEPQIMNLASIDLFRSKALADRLATFAENDAAVRTASGNR